MFKESKPPSCEARQQSDQMRCEKCNLLWDMNDPEPPECLSECYQCGIKTAWLAPDSRCGDCTRLTVDEIKGN